MDKKLITISGILIITFLAFTGYMLFRSPLSNFTRAANQGGTVSAVSSLVFAWPLSVPADSVSKADVTVFVRDVDGRGLSQKQVTAKSSIGKWENEQVVTDSDGKAMFVLTSGTAGVANLEFYVDNKKLEKSITIQFR